MLCSTSASFFFLTCSIQREAQVAARESALAQHVTSQYYATENIVPESAHHFIQVSSPPLLFLAAAPPFALFPVQPQNILIFCSLFLAPERVKTAPYTEHVPALHWSVEDVCNWLSVLPPELAAYTSNFMENRVDGRSLLSLTMETLRDDLNIKPYGHRMALFTHIQNIQRITDFPPLAATVRPSAAHDLAEAAAAAAAASRACPEKCQMRFVVSYMHDPEHHSFRLLISPEQARASRLILKVEFLLHRPQSSSFTTNETAEVHHAPFEFRSVSNPSEKATLVCNITFRHQLVRRTTLTHQQAIDGRDRRQFISTVLSAKPKARALLAAMLTPPEAGTNASGNGSGKNAAHAADARQNGSAAPLLAVPAIATSISRDGLAAAGPGVFGPSTSTLSNLGPASPHFWSGSEGATSAASRGSAHSGEKRPTSHDEARGRTGRSTTRSNEAGGDGGGGGGLSPGVSPGVSAEDVQARLARLQLNLQGQVENFSAFQPADQPADVGSRTPGSASVSTPPRSRSSSRRNSNAATPVNLGAAPRSAGTAGSSASSTSGGRRSGHHSGHRSNSTANGGSGGGGAGGGDVSPSMLYRRASQPPAVNAWSRGKNPITNLPVNRPVISQPSLQSWAPVPASAGAASSRSVSTEAASLSARTPADTSGASSPHRRRATTADSFGPALGRGRGKPR